MKMEEEKIWKGEREREREGGREREHDVCNAVLGKQSVKRISRRRRHQCAMSEHAAHNRAE